MCAYIGLCVCVCVCVYVRVSKCINVYVLVCFSYRESVKTICRELLPILEV